MSNAKKFKAIQTRILNLDTPHFCDGAPGKVKILAPLTCYSLQNKMAGIAHTVSSEGHLLAVLKGLLHASPNEVLVIDAGEELLAQMGEIFATYAQTKHLAGIIINGACRDVDAISKLSIPFYAKSICAKAGGAKKIGKTQVPITLLDVNKSEITINPGDFIVSDVNGIVTFSAHEMDEILKSAEAIQQKEVIILEKIKSGHSLADFFLNFEEHCCNLKAKIPSSLIFGPK